MAHHLAGISNSAKRRMAEAAETAEHEVETAAGGFMSKAAEAGSNVLHGVKSGLNDITTASKNGLSEAENAIEEQIVDRPFISVLVALSAGIMLGSLMTTLCMRRSSR